MNVGEFRLDPNKANSLLSTTYLELPPNDLPLKDTDRAFVREALLPFVVWEDVPFRTLEPRELGRMEVFILQAALELRQFRFDELSDVTDIPLHVMITSAQKLMQRGAIFELEMATYAANENQAKQMLSTKNVMEERSRWLTLVYFPRQDIIVANQQMTRRLAEITKRLRAPGRAPFRDDVQLPSEIPTFLAQRRTEGRIFGYEHQLVNLLQESWAKPPKWPELVPCYYARGSIEEKGNATIADMHLWGFPRQRSERREYRGEPIQLMGVPSLIREWVSLTDGFQTLARESVPGFPRMTNAHIERQNPCRHRAWVTHTEATEVALSHRLTDPLSISICSPMAKVDVRMVFEPVDRHAAALFALDSIAQRIDELRRPYSDRQLMEHIQWARQRYPESSSVNITRAQVENRLWHLKRFMAIYEHRAIEDFAYG